MTLPALETPPDTEKSLCLPAELKHLPTVLAHVRQMAESAGVVGAQASRLELAVEEALVNVCHYAYADCAESGLLYCRIAVRPNGIWVEIADEGPPFNPLAQPDPDTALELDQRKPGGLGILLIKKLVSEIAYRREDGRNVLAIGMLT